MIIGHRNYRSCDEVMIKLPYDEFVTIYDHHNNYFSKIWSLMLFLLAYLVFTVYYFRLWFMNMHIFMNIFGNRSILTLTLLRNSSLLYL